MVDPAGKRIIVYRSTTPLQPGEKARSCVSHQFELNGAAGLLLDHERTLSYLRSTDQGTDLDLYEIATPQFAIDGEIKQRAISQPPLSIEEEADRPYLPRFQGPFRTNLLSCVRGSPPLRSRIKS